MKPQLILLVLISVLLSAGSQILLKTGMTSNKVKSLLESQPGIFDLAIGIATSPAVITGLLCFGLSAIVWLFVLARIPLSSAYPFVALGIAITVVAGHVIFAEPLSMGKLIGAGLILIGIGTVAVSS